MALVLPTTSGHWALFSIKGRLTREESFSKWMELVTQPNKLAQLVAVARGVKRALDFASSASKRVKTWYPLKKKTNYGTMGRVGPRTRLGPANKYVRTWTKTKRKKRRRRKKTLTRRVKRIGRRVSRLAKIATESKLVVKVRGMNRYTSAVNQVNHNYLDLFTYANLTSRFLTIPYWDPATNTVTDRNVQAANSSKNFYFKCFAQCVLKNETNFPVTIRVYMLSPKQDTNRNPVLAVQDGILERSSGALNDTSPLFYPTDSQEFTRSWRVRKRKKAYLRAGDVMKITTSTRLFKYNGADGHTTQYQKKLESRVLLIRQEGPISHDCTTPNPDNLAFGESAVTVYTKKMYKIFYDGGAKMTRYQLFDTDVVNVLDPTATLPEVPAFVQFSSC